MVYFWEEIGNLCPTNWFKQGSIIFFFLKKLNLGKKLNVNFARISKTPPLHEVEFSLFSRNLKFKIKTRRRNSLITRKQKIAEDKSKVSPEIWKHPKSEKKKVSEFRTPPKIAKMFPNFGYPQKRQRCFRISDTLEQCKDVSEFRIPPNSAKMFHPRSAEFFISYESRAEL